MRRGKGDVDRTFYGKYFSHSTLHDELIDCCKSVEAALIRIKLDINGTRMTARHGLLHSIVRLKEALKLFQTKQNVDRGLSAGDWEDIRFFEGILAIAEKAVKLSQHENLFMGALSSMVKMDMLRKLRYSSISVADLGAVTASPVSCPESASMSVRCLL